MEIKTKSGHTILIDDEDWEIVKGHTWSASVLRNTHRTQYARAFCNKKSISMHRLIMKAQKGQVIDHIDGNGLNNQKSNLRFCNLSQNSHNAQKCISKRTSKFKGVYFSQNHQKWRAQITLNWKQIQIGCFSTELEAAIAYNKAAIELHGEFARLNEV